MKIQFAKSTPNAVFHYIYVSTNMQVRFMLINSYIAFALPLNTTFNRQIVSSITTQDMNKNN